MKLYLHRTDGGAEYYVTNPEGRMDFKGCYPVLRTDGDELEVLPIENIKLAGFKSVKLSIITDNERADILNALHDMRSKYEAWPTNELSQERMKEIDALVEKLKAIL